MSQLLFFLREALRSLRLHRTANIISVACIALALISLSFIVGTWSNLEHILDTLRAEAEIVVYLRENVSSERVEEISAEIQSYDGVLDTRVISPDETVSRIEGQLGGDFDILNMLDGYNPFTYSIEVGVDPAGAPQVASFAARLGGVEGVRDNEQILEPLARITAAARWIGTALILAVGAVTLVIVSHIVRLGIEARSEEIETLRLLGASEWFVAVPFVLEGALLGGFGAAACLALLAVGGPTLYGLVQVSLPFMPLLAADVLFTQMAALIAGIGVGAGTLGSLVSVRS